MALFTDGFGYVGRAVSILNSGRTDNKPDQLPKRIGIDMTVVAFDLLACFESTRLARVGRFHRLDWLSIRSMVGDAERPASSRIILIRV